MHQAVNQTDLYFVVRFFLTNNKIAARFYTTPRYKRAEGFQPESWFDEAVLHGKACKLGIVAQVEFL